MVVVGIGFEGLPLAEEKVLADLEVINLLRQVDAVLSQDFFISGNDCLVIPFLQGLVAKTFLDGHEFRIVIEPAAIGLFKGC